MVAFHDVNAELVRLALDRLSAGGESGLCGSLLAEDVRWLEPGRNLVAGEYRGCDEVVGSLYRRLHRLSGGTFRIGSWEGVVTDGDRAIALYSVLAHREGRDLLSRDVCVLRLGGGTVREGRVFHGDQRTWDAFWS